MTIYFIHKQLLLNTYRFITLEIQTKPLLIRSSISAKVEIPFINEKSWNFAAVCFPRCSQPVCNNIVCNNIVTKCWCNRYSIYSSKVLNLKLSASIYHWSNMLYTSFNKKWWIFLMKWYWHGHVPHTKLNIKTLLIINKGDPRYKPDGLFCFLFIATNK